MHKALTVTQALHALKSPLAAKKEFTDGINARIQCELTGQRRANAWSR